MPSEALPAWDLSDLYHGIEDPQIKADLQTIAEQAESFARTYQKNLSTLALPEIKKSLEAYASILQSVRKLEAYAYLEYSTHTTSTSYGAFLQKITTHATDIVGHVLFFEIEISRLADQEFQVLLQDQSLSEYHHFLHKQKDWKPHRLSHKEERILLKKSLTSSRAFVRLYHERSTQQLYSLGEAGQENLVTLSELMSRGRSPQQRVREAAARARHTVHKDDPHGHTFTYNTLIQDWHTDTQLRNFAQPEDIRHLENEISRPVVDAMVDTVVEQYPLVHDYYALKKDVLSVATLYDYDRYAPLHSHETHYSFAEAQRIVLDAFQNFSVEFSETARLFFDNNWIDVPPSSTKQAGAFCHYCTPDTHPYISLNYTGTANDVSILAHELGHGIHACMARRQNIINFDWPLTIAETASVFAEMLVFESLKKAVQDPQEKLALYMGKLENIFATISRQTAIFRFERQAHDLRTTHGELTDTQLNELWVKEQAAMFGDSLTITEYERSYWQLISHIFQSPFYVYSYAFGELLTLSLFEMFQEDPAGFIPKYIELLRAGGSQSPHDLLQPFGIDLTDHAFWCKGFEPIETLIVEAKSLAAMK